MKFEEFRKITPTYVPPEVKTGELMDEVNEAFEALGDASKFLPLVINGVERVAKRRCPQCAFFSIATHCPRCSGHPVMLPVGYMQMAQRMSEFGRACNYFASSTCIEKMELKTTWCRDCEKFWDKELNIRPNQKILKFPDGINPALKPRIVKNVAQQDITAEDAWIDDKIDYEEECEEAYDKLDTTCNLLVQIGQLLDYLGDPQLTGEVKPEDRKEIYCFITAIEEVVTKCGYNPEDMKAENENEVDDPQAAFNERDKELIEKMANDPRD